MAFSRRGSGMSRICLGAIKTKEHWRLGTCFSDGKTVHLPVADACVNMLFSFADLLGRISVNDWCDTVAHVLDLHLPWRTLKARLVDVDSHGFVLYQSTFRNKELHCSLNTSMSEVSNAWLIEKFIICPWSETTKSLPNNLSKQRSPRNSLSSHR